MNYVLDVIALKPVVVVHFVPCRPSKHHLPYTHLILQQAVQYLMTDDAEAKTPLSHFST